MVSRSHSRRGEWFWINIDCQKWSRTYLKYSLGWRGIAWSWFERVKNSGNSKNILGYRRKQKVYIYRLWTRKIKVRTRV